VWGFFSSPYPVSLSTLCFRVAGHPVTQGSKRGFAVGGHVRLVESGGDKHKLWRHAVNDEARRKWVEAPLTGAVALLLVFDIQPPKTLTKARRAAGPIGAHSGDVDKLARAVLDSLTGVVYLDDSQVRPLVVDKQWAGPAGPGVTITITPRSAP
jgi:Holliday junction resolvase RusA-like endonuclease